MILNSGCISFPTRDEINQIIKLMTTCMREDKSHQDTNYMVDQEYPNIFSESNFENIWALKESGKIVSALAAYPLYFTTSNFNPCAIGIGSVSTDPTHRKRGLSTLLHKQALSYYKNKGFDFSILWTDLFDYYRKLGYELVGEEIVFVIENKIDTPSLSMNIRPYSKNDFEDIYTIYNKHKNSPARKKEAFLKNLLIPDMEILCALKENKVIAYTIRGKGSDFKSTIHEWGGEFDALIMLLNRNLENEGKTTYLISPGKEELNSILEEKNLPPHLGKLGMIKLLNPEGLLNKLSSFKIKTSAAANDTIRISSENKTLVIDEKELCKFIFGTTDEFNFSECEHLSLKELFQNLPLNLFVWGLDSV